MPVPRAWACALAVGALSAAAVALAGPASAGVSHLAHLTTRTAIDYHPTSHVSATAALAPSIAGGLPTFTGTQKDGTQTFRFTMIGKNPRVHLANPITTVPTEVVPLRFVFANGTTSDPTVGSTCDSTPALTRTMNSPVVKNLTWTFGGKTVGTTQYGDAFRRAEFWTYTKKGALNPGYHVKLTFKALPVQTIDVPRADSAKGNASCGPERAVEFNWLENYLQTTLLPHLRSQGRVKANTFPLFLTDNTVAYVTHVKQCCVLGFHNAFNAGGGIQTYGFADYQNNNFFASDNLHNVEIASHEIAEWMDDPLGTNSTKPWGNIGQVAGCQTNLEVGDPLTGKTISRKVGTHTYHLQELAFFSWFYHQKPSVGVNNWYSNKGTFKSPAKACP